MLHRLSFIVYFVFLFNGFCFGQKSRKLISLTQIISPLKYNPYYKGNDSLKRLNVFDSIHCKEVSFKDVLNEKNIRKFSKEVFFEECLFTGRTLFNSIEFFDLVNFKAATFEKYATFDESVFNKLTFFSNIQVGNTHKNRLKKANLSKISFDRAIFKRNVHFNSSTISQATFEETKFIKTATFTNTIFKGNISFKGASFGGIAKFTKAIFKGKGKFNFRNVVLPDTLYFNNVDLSDYNGVIDFSQARLKKQGKPCLIYLADTDVSKIRIQYTQFRLYFPPQYDTLPEKKLQVYKRLLARLKSDGLTASVKELDIETKKLQNINKGPAWFGQIQNIINELWWEFGYNRERILLSATAFLILFWLINFVFFYNMLHKTYEIPKINGRHEISLNVNEISYYENLPSLRIKNLYRFLLIIVFWTYLITFPIIGIYKFFALLYYTFIKNGFPERPGASTIDNETQGNGIRKFIRKKMGQAMPKIRYLYTRFYLSLFYTGYIFFSLKVELSELKYQGNWWGFRLAYFFMIYLVGLASLAYLVGYVVVQR